MDADGLPLIGPTVDYEKVAPINQKKTVEYLNHFIIHTAGFLNHFSTVCEEKLVDLSTRIEKLNIQMALLEGKINSIPGLRNITAATTTSQQPEPSTSKTISSQSVSSVSHSEPASHEPPVPQSLEHKDKEATVEEQPVNTVSQDPRYMKYFKMLNFGVPVMAIKQKMILEGLNPDLLDTPSAAAPGGGNIPPATTQDKDDDFSEDEDEDDEQMDSDGSASFSD